ncbi:ABC transporter G family member 1-like isoform X2 [Salvia miltiorrhiza]|uniref:ABC transporter G family member 1-like isoform X2 n=1 Tax=Salvia miltiorrhiza TaxID=226208 RepID=UPI0025AC34A9|nr:ABC transporter G family member 1-like isoform X2 [Salvia miltiorrhiza]
MAAHPPRPHRLCPAGRGPRHHGPFRLRQVHSPRRISRLDSNTRQKGDILINGRKQQLAFGISSYLPQDDALVTTLTVREAVYYSALLQLPDSMSESEKKARAEGTIREMGLNDAMDTRIGGWNVKGLSGGQKRRVSICIELLRRPKLLFLDEPTSGLDSAASYHVMKHIVQLAQHQRITVVASIHQPSTEVFELFHNLCLLSCGQTVYFGSTIAANQFFETNGFVCPPKRNPSDHYLRTINQDFDSDIEQGFAKEAITVLVKAYERSDIFRQVKQCVDEIRLQKNGLTEKKGKQAGFITQCAVLTRRSSLNMFRDVGYYWFRFGIYTALCLCVGTVFHNIGSTYSSIQARASMLVFVSSFMTFMAIGGFPSFVEDMKVFTRERLNGHYSVAAFVAGNSISSAPYLFLVTAIPGAIAYYLVGLQGSANHFSYFVLLLLSCMMLVESLMMLVAALVPNFLIGIISGAGIQGIMILNNGFFRLPNDIPKVLWKFPVYYMSFQRYANEGFYKNEFEGLMLPDGQSGQVSGAEILARVWQIQMGRSKWVDLGVIVGMVVAYRLLFWGAIMAAEIIKHNKSPNLFRRSKL